MAAPHLEIPFVDGHADVWRLFDDPVMLANVAEALVAPFRRQLTKLLESSRGFILVPPLRSRSGSASYDQEGRRSVTRRKGNDYDHAGLARESAYAASAASTLRNGDRVLLVDDWIETGSQALAAKSLIEECGAILVAVATVVTEASPATLESLGRTHALMPARAS